MYETFDRFEYIGYLRTRWRVVAVACAAAVLLSLGISVLLPKRYTATASIVIEPPGGIDARTATSVSPVYLESLKTYEQFAASDSLFARAVEKFRLQQADPSSIESLKQRVLKVAKLRDTKILEISATFPDPKVAQGFVQYLAEETVNMSRGENLANDQELIEDARKQVSDAQDRLERAQRARGDYAAREPVDGLKDEVESGVELQTKLREQLADAETNVAEYQERAKEADGEFALRQLPAMRARAALLQKRTGELAASIGEKSATLARRVAQRENLETELKSSQAAYEIAAARLRDARSGSGSRGERLRVIDPGIVPQRPSAPNIPLNVIVALCLSLLASIVYLSLAFGFRRGVVGFERPVSTGRRG